MSRADAEAKTGWRLLFTFGADQITELHHLGSEWFYRVRSVAGIALSGDGRGYQSQGPQARSESVGVESDVWPTRPLCVSQEVLHRGPMANWAGNGPNPARIQIFFDVPELDIKVFNKKLANFWYQALIFGLPSRAI